MGQKQLIAILGAGESGVGAAVLAKKQGYEVFVSDSGPVRQKYAQMLDDAGLAWESGQHSLDIIMQAHEIIKSPGIPDTVSAPLVVDALKRGIPVISEIEFAARFTPAFKVCITGSNGKTTTTTLVYEILKNNGFNVGLAGNVGKSFAMQVAENNFDYYVLELSSFQLDTMFSFKAEVAILLNITPDHLDRYSYRFDNYVASKFRILQNMTEADCFIYNADDSSIKAYIEKNKLRPQALGFSLETPQRPGAYLQNGKIRVAMTEKEDLELDISELGLRGKHNHANSMAAAIAAKVVDIKNDRIRKSMNAFCGVEHRLERLPFNVRGVQFVNDSKATNVNSVWYALESMDDDNVVWIVGGKDKGNDYSELFGLIDQKVKAIICMGADNSIPLDVFTHLGKPIFSTSSMAEAVQTAYNQAQKGDTVLLSPACASFDLFQNYEDRGCQFKEAVRSL